jgi:flagellar motor switch protein FliG
LGGNSWVLAKTVSENTQYSLVSFLPVKFDIILKMDDRAIQRVFRELDSQELAMAMKGEKEAIKEKVFSNMSLRAAEMLKEDMEYMGRVRKSRVKECQDKIVEMIQYLEYLGEIVIAHEEDTVK